MIDKKQLRQLTEVILQEIGLESESAVNLILGTIAQESRFGSFLWQLGNGPAKGFIQMEPETEKDIWDNFLRLRYKPTLVKKIEGICGVNAPSPFKLTTDIAYQIIMCRLQYYRDYNPLPDPDDLKGLAKYYKRVYNTIHGKATEEEFIANYKKYVLDQK